MLRDVLKVLPLSLAILVGPTMAADRADEYQPFTRLSDNYELRSRKQNYDEFEFPTSINKKIRVEGEKTTINYNYKDHTNTASRLEFKRHFESLVAKVGGEVVYSGHTNDHHFAVSFKFPKNGKIAWGFALPNDRNEVYSYQQVFIETSEAWGGAAAPIAVQAPQPAKAQPEQVAPAPKPAPVPPIAQAESAAPWNGGDWVEVRFGGCDVPDVGRSKSAMPDDDLCDAKLNGKVAICNADLGGCFYKNVTPKQCKDGSRSGRMYVCKPR